MVNKKSMQVVINLFALDEYNPDGLIDFPDNL